MEIKLFGKSLFSANKGGGLLALSQNPSSEVNKSKYLPDFYDMPSDMESFVSITEVTSMSMEGLISTKAKKKKKAKATPKLKEKAKLTPKGVHELKLLNDEIFEIKVDPKSVDEQIQDFSDKLGLIKSEEWDVRNGVKEISSILTRFENRKKYKEVSDFFDEYPYTTTSRVNALVKSKDHNNLKVGKIAQFIADMPKEAVTAMKEYNKYTDKVCGKQAVFYIIADKKDFKKTDSRRDPILLAQSPFGHFWQILGAWDEEMLFLEEL